jgi:hypothetical protein
MRALSGACDFAARALVRRVQSVRRGGSTMKKMIKTETKRSLALSQETIKRIDHTALRGALGAGAMTSKACDEPVDAYPTPWK